MVLPINLSFPATAVFIPKVGQLYVSDRQFYGHYMPGLASPAYLEWQMMYIAADTGSLFSQNST